MTNYTVRFGIYDPDDQALCLTGTFDTAADAQDFIKQFGPDGLMCERPLVVEIHVDD